MEIKINDQYWLNFAHDLIDGSLKRIDEEIATVRDYVDKIKIPYALIAIAESIFLNFQENWLIHIIILAIPLGLIEWSKWYLNIATINDATTINYRNPPAIERAYDAIFKESYSKLQKAKRISQWATIAMFLALVGGAIYYGTFKVKEEEKKIAEEQNKIYFDMGLSTNQKEILFTGRFPEGEKIEIAAQRFFDEDSVVTKSQEFLIGDQGIFLYQEDVPEGLKKADYLVKYKVANKTRAFLETIKVE